MRFTAAMLSLTAMISSPALCAVIARQATAPGPDELWLCENPNYDKCHSKDLTQVATPGSYGPRNDCIILDDTNLRPIKGEGVTSARADPAWDCSLYKSADCNDNSVANRYQIPANGTDDLRTVKPTTFDDVAVAYRCSPRVIDFA